MSGLVCPRCEEGHRKCECDKEEDNFVSEGHPYKIVICKTCNYKMTCCEHEYCRNCLCSEWCWID